MDAYQPGRVVRVLTGILTATYVAAWVMTGLIVAGAALAELVADRDTLEKFTIGVPATAQPDERGVAAVWNGATGTIGLKPMEASLAVPLSLAPAWFRLISYAGILTLCAVLLMFLHQLRGLFRSARDGAPFDPRNTARLRWMGGLLIAGHVLGRAFGAWQAAAVLRVIASTPLRISAPFALDERALFSLNESVLLGGLLLIALGEIFKRGAALEDEQSLVV